MLFFRAWHGISGSSFRLFARPSISNFRERSVASDTCNLRRIGTVSSFGQFHQKHSIRLPRRSVMLRIVLLVKFALVSHAKRERSGERREHFLPSSYRDGEALPSWHWQSLKRLSPFPNVPRVFSVPFDGEFWGKPPRTFEYKRIDDSLVNAPSFKLYRASDEFAIKIEISRF